VHCACHTRYVVDLSPLIVPVYNVGRRERGSMIGKGGRGATGEEEGGRGGTGGEGIEHGGR
jgi:hypothetical protein